MQNKKKPAKLQPVTVEQEAMPKKRPAWVEATERLALANMQHSVKFKERITEQGKVVPEVIGDSSLELACKYYETTGFTDDDGIKKVLCQVIEALPEHAFNNLSETNGILAIMNGIAPQNPMEGLFAAQMTTAYNLAMEFSRRAMKAEQSAESLERNINQATKMMKAFTAQAEALQKLRNKGQQKITVQHVQVNQGGQAVIGDVHHE